jgi:hypothetical protein
MLETELETDKSSLGMSAFKKPDGGSNEAIFTRRHDYEACTSIIKVKQNMTIYTRILVPDTESYVGL